MTIFKQFTFDSAHFLPLVPEGHKCKAIHGHTYKLTIFINGPIGEATGWVFDFADVKRIVGPIVDSVDHKLLNNIEGLSNPTCELLAVWLWDRIRMSLPLIKRIELYETPTSGVIYEGN
jgi:6-pyruvoyltetrahydropterin/6-carboxytetrahydropterin synthase